MKITGTITGVIPVARSIAVGEGYTARDGEIKASPFTINIDCDIDVSEIGRIIKDVGEHLRRL